MARQIPKNSAGLILTRDSEDGFLDLQVIEPENRDEYLVQVATLAAQLLEQALFGEVDEEEEDDDDLFIEYTGDDEL